MESIFQFTLDHFQVLEMIVFWYPVIMGMLWVIGGLIYYFRIERKEPLPLPATPLVSVLVPAYNESANLLEVVERLTETTYPNYEILIINDGSQDDTRRYGNLLEAKYDKVRFVDLQENCGKANALYLGFLASKGEYLVCVDGDSYLDKDCIRYLMAHFLNPNNGERVGAVTGNPRVRNRSSLFSKIQLCEYASIISLIKRTQRIWGKVMTVSGVVVAYRKQALLDCGLWDRDMITEDIGVTWKLERNFWDIRYEPNALCWMLAPESLKGLFKQRVRWAQGGQEVMFRHAGIFKSWRRRRMYPVYAEQVFSLTWVVLWLLLTITELIKLCYHTGDYMTYLWKSQFLAVICMFQFFVALGLERRYDKGIFKYMMIAAWYPVVYWVVNGLVALVALPKTIFRKRKTLATWKSPDRGIGTAMEVEEKPEDTDLENVGLEDADSEEAGSKENVPRENIIDGKQVLWKKVLEVMLTGFAWLFILIYVLYMIYGTICLVGGMSPHAIWIYNERVVTESLHLLYITFIIVLIEIVVMIFWKEYNRRRYGSLRRRTFKPDASIEQIAEFFSMKQEEVSHFQEQKNIVLPHNIISDDLKAERRSLFGELLKTNKRNEEKNCVF